MKGRNQRKEFLWHRDGSLPSDHNTNTIFVFGSNLAGRHGAGAARVARLRFGAEPGIGVGFRGRSYAIATKDRALQRLSLMAIADAVEVFLEFAREHSQLYFFITRIGCGLAGYADGDVAPLFADAPANCDFANEWRRWLTTRAKGKQS